MCQADMATRPLRPPERTLSTERGNRLRWHGKGLTSHFPHRKHEKANNEAENSRCFIIVESYLSSISVPICVIDSFLVNVIGNVKCTCTMPNSWKWEALNLLHTV